MKNDKWQFVVGTSDFYLSLVIICHLTANSCHFAKDPRLRARAEITSHFAAGLRAAARRGTAARARIGFVAAPRRCPTSPASRRLASARPALAPKCEFISARALSLDKGSPNVKPRTVFFSRTPEESVFLPDINLTGHKPHRTVVRETLRRARP